jgi:hypothetical protein
MAAGELGIAGVVALLVVTVVAATVLRGSRTQPEEGAAQSSGAALPPAQGGQLAVASANSRTARHPVATLVMKTSGLLALLPAAWWVVLGIRWGDATCVDDPDACAEAMVFAFTGFPVLLLALLVAAGAAIWRLT